MSNINITQGGSYGEMYLHDNTVEASIEAVNQWHGAGGHTQGSLSFWTFSAGALVDILSFADYSGTVAGTIKATTDGAHNFTTGDPICIIGTNVAIGGADEYAGVYTITVVDSDEFYFTNANWNATTTAKAILPDRLVAGSEAGGFYFVHGAGSMSSADVDKEYDLAAFINAAQSNNINVRLIAKHATSFSTIAGGGVVSISAGDCLWLGVRGVTDATNLTIRNANTFIHKI